MSEMALKLIRQAKAEKWKSLDLGNCGIKGELPSELRRLINLEELILSDKWWDVVAVAEKSSHNNGPQNRIRAMRGGSLPPNLESLVAQGLGLSDLLGFAPLVKLHTLNLDDNVLANIGPLADLENLRWLYLTNNQVADVGPLTALENLTALNLANNQVVDIRPLTTLANLKSLNLAGNQVADAGPLAALENLTALNLTNNQVADIRPLATLANLKSLNLAGNQFADIESLARLANLKSLDLGQNQVSDITALEQLTQLARLTLYNTEVADIKALAQLKQLTKLDLWGTQVADIKVLPQLTQLTYLDLQDTQVADIDALVQLTQLTSLYLSGTQVTDINALAQLTQLTTLDLRGTQVADIKDLTHLIKNKEIKVNMGALDADRGIFLKNCPLTNPPVEIVAQGNEAILWYLDGGNDVVVREAKVLLVGEPESGKSSLYLRMFDPEKPLPKLEERTDGIDIHPQIIGKRKDARFQLNIWDFGGQEVLLNTHQFFFSKRSVYILLVKGSQNISRLDHEYFREWLGWIDLLGGKSPILFFQNRIGGHGETIEVEFFQRKFPLVKEAFGGDLLNNAGAAKGIRKALEYYAGELTLLNCNWKERHLRIRRALEALPKEQVMISWAAFRAICTEHGETEEAGAKHLSNFFHEIGVCLHYQPLKEDEEELLSNWVILDNQWATTGVYQMVLDDDVRFKQFGRFTVKDQRRIWNAPQYADRHDIMVRLMERFEICYPLADVKPKTWLIPQHLHAKHPKTVNEPEGNVLVVRYEYEFIPKGILNRLMTRMNRFVKEPEKAWRDGVVFAKEGASLLARLNFKHDEISLTATGDTAERIKLLTFITDDLERIHKEFENIVVEKWIPCRCNTCEGNPGPHAYKYSTLMNMKLQGERGIKIKCEKVPFREESVEKLLDGFQNDTDPDGTGAQWKLQAKYREEELGDYKGMIRDLRRDQKKILQNTNEIPVIHEKIDLLIDRLSEADRKIVEVLGLQAKHQNELVALLVGQETILSQNDQQLEEDMDNLLAAIENAEMRNEELFQGFAMALSEELRGLWPKASDEPMKAEMKGKWKFTIPFIPGFLKYELEAGTDYSKAFQQLIDGLGGATDRTVLRLQDKARKVWERGQMLLGNGN